MFRLRSRHPLKHLVSDTDFVNKETNVVRFTKKSRWLFFEMIEYAYNNGYRWECNNCKHKLNYFKKSQFMYCSMCASPIDYHKVKCLTTKFSKRSLPNIDIEAGTAFGTGKHGMPFAFNLDKLNIKPKPNVKAKSKFKSFAGNKKPVNKYRVQRDKTVIANESYFKSLINKRNQSRRKIKGAKENKLSHLSFKERQRNERRLKKRLNGRKDNGSTKPKTKIKFQGQKHKLQIPIGKLKTKKTKMVKAVKMSQEAKAETISIISRMNTNKINYEKIFHKNMFKTID